MKTFLLIILGLSFLNHILKGSGSARKKEKEIYSEEASKHRMVKFNLNDSIYVKLNNKGYKILADDWNKTAKKIPAIGLKSPQFYKEEADKDGYTKIQLWVFTQKFGEHTTMGPRPPYDMIILFREKDLEGVEE